MLKQPQPLVRKPAVRWDQQERGQGEVVLPAVLKHMCGRNRRHRRKHKGSSGRKCPGRVRRPARYAIDGRGRGRASMAARVRPAESAGAGGWFVAAHPVPAIREPHGPRRGAGVDVPHLRSGPTPVCFGSQIDRPCRGGLEVRPRDIRCGRVRPGFEEHTPGNCWLLALGDTVKDVFHGDDGKVALSGHGHRINPVLVRTWLQHLQSLRALRWWEGLVERL